MKQISLYLPELWIRSLDDLVPYHYPNRAEVIRAAVRDLLVREVWGSIGTPDQKLIRYPTQSSEETGGVLQCPKKPAR